MDGGESPEAGNMCAGCDSRCCRLRVDLTSYDILRIALFAGKDVSKFVLSLEAKPEDDLAFRCNGKLAKLILAPGDGPCVFLRKSGALRCEVQDAKPAICITYPYEVRGGSICFRNDAACPKTKRILTTPAGISPNELEDACWEFDRYCEFVADWNVLAKGGERAEDFLNFAFREMHMEQSFPGSLLRMAKRAFRKLRRSRK